MNRIEDSSSFDSRTEVPLITDLRELVAYRFLLRNLVARDLKARYKNSILGFLWSFLNPLLMMVVYTLLFTILIPSSVIRKYYIFILVALIPWQFLSGTMITGTVSIVGNNNLIKKVYFPRIALPASAVISNLVNFLLAFLVLVIFLLGSGVGITVHALWVPLILLTQVVFLMGMSLLLGTLQTFYRDVLMIIDVLLLPWFFLTPIFYPYEQLSESALLFGISFNPAQVMRWLNPMASIIDAYRTVLWGTMSSNGPVGMDPVFLLRTLIQSIIIFFIGYFVFVRYEHLFGEKL
jgi:ABC-type polysaccharide/polyol phosphate export permease